MALSGATTLRHQVILRDIVLGILGGVFSGAIITIISSMGFTREEYRLLSLHDLSSRPCVRFRSILD